MNTAPTSSRQHAEGEHRSRRVAWRPTWAVLVAVVAALLMLYPFVYGIALIIHTVVNDPGELGRDLGVAIGGLAVAVSAVGLLPLGWFLWRGGRLAWGLGVFVGLFWVWYFSRTMMGLG